MPYIAKQPGTAFRTFTDKDTFTGDGSTTTFDMQFAIAEAGQNDLQIFVGSTRQIPGTDYTLGVDGSSEYKRITFTSAPADSSTITVLNPGTVQGEFSSVADNAVTSGKLNVDAITGQTELAEAAANNDTLLIHDTSASALKKIQVQNLTAQAGDGLSKTNSTLAVDIPNTTLLDAGAATNDELLIYDTSANALKSITQVNLLNFPSISSVSPTNATSGDGTGNFTFTITGSGFTGSTASLVNSSSQTVSFDSQTVDSDTQITGVIAKSSLPNSGEPYDVRVTAATGLQSTLEDQINVDANPVWSTAAGSIATIFDGQRASYGNITVAAADPESGGDITYTLESGSLPSGMSGTSTSSGYVISGTANAVGTNTTSTFTIRAKDVNSNTADRQFTITVYAPVVTSFTSSGTFTVPTGLASVDVLVVAGGGAGGGDNGGGGGAGGLIYRPGFPITPGTPISVTVGDGGPEPGQTAHGAIPGSDTVFSTLTAKGGGGGGGQANAGGGQGGSGGGGNGHQGYPGNDFGNGTQPNQPGDSGNYGFGNDGASGQPSAFFGGGGGGAGGGATSYVNGGSSKSYSISGTSVAYAGGGGGGSNGLGGGSGGGGGAGQGSNTTGNPATANRGSGGGGGGNANPRPGGSGGKGIVIVSY